MASPEVPADTGKEPHRERGSGLRAALLAAAALFALALGVRLAFLGALRSSYLADERPLIADSNFYDLRGKEIAQGEFLGREPGYLSPVYCFFLGGLYALGLDMQDAKTVQAFLGALTCVLLFALGRRVFGTAAGVIAGGFFALYRPHVFYGGLLLPSTLVTLLNVLFLALAVPGARAPGLGRLLLSGMVLGLAIGTKPNALLILPAAALWALFALRELRVRRRLGLAAALTLGTALTLAPVTWRNYLVSGELVLVSVVGGRNLLKGNGPDADGSHVFLPPGEQGISLHSIRTRDIDPALAVADDRKKRQQALDYMRRHPGRTAVLWLKKLHLFFHRLELGIRDQIDFAVREIPPLGRVPFTYGLLAPVGTVGALLALGRRRAWLLHVMLAVQVASFVLVFVLGRYRLVAAACLTVFAAGQAVRWAGQVRSRAWKPLLGSGALVAVVSLPVFWPLDDFPPDRGWADQYQYIGLQRRDAGDWEGAIAAWRGALATPYQNDRSRMSDAQLYLEIARCHERLGRPEAALQALEQALRVADAPPPAPPEVYLSLARALARLGHADEACLALDKAEKANARTDPQDRAERLRQDVADLRRDLCP
jgi:Dolichyl-phosphate-mannose-protein mannosyltransferase/Tetratricopeptide repeat